MNKIIQTGIFLLIIWSLQTVTAFCQTANEDLQRRVGNFADGYAADGNFSGSVLLAKNGKIIYEKSFGLADREKHTAFTDKTASSVASVGKMFTAVLILQLAEEKKISLSDSIRKHLPKTKIPNADKITIRHLLEHSSGLGSFFTHPHYSKLPKNAVESDALIALVEQEPLRFDEPGTRFEYSNSGYVVLGMIIERATGKRYADALDERIIRRLNLKNTQFEIDRTNFKNLANGYQKRAETNEWRLAEAFPVTAAAGVFSTPRDLFQFSQALFGGKLLNRESLAMMIDSRIEMPRQGQDSSWIKLNYGYGVEIRGYENNLFSIGHNDWMPGYNAEFQHFPVGRDKYTLIITSNYELRLRRLLLGIQSEILRETNKITKPTS